MVILLKPADVVVLCLFLFELVGTAGLENGQVELLLIYNVTNPRLVFLARRENC